MKKRALSLVSSCAAIALCSSLIAGSTYALFTSEDKVNIAVTSGKVAVSATVSDLQTFSTLNNRDAVEGELVDGVLKASFQNGGEAIIDGGSVSLNNITPGDVAKFAINVDNSATTVSAKYRLSYEVTGGYLLADGLKVTISDREMSDENGIYQSYTTAWKDDAFDKIEVTVAFPDHGELDNLYMDLSTDLNFMVEAIQSNGAGLSGDEQFSYLTDFSDYKAAALQGVTEVTSTQELTTAIANGGVVKVTENIDLERMLEATSDTYLVGNGANISLPKSASGSTVVSVQNLENEVTIAISGVNLVNEFARDNYARTISLYNNSGTVNIIIDDSYIEGEHYPINVASYNAQVNVTVRNSTIQGYCAFQTWSSNTTFVMENCTLFGLNVWEPGWNDFAVVKVNTGVENVSVTLNDCTVVAKQTAGSIQRFFTVNQNTSGEIICNGCTFISDDKVVLASAAFAKENTTQDENSIFNDYLLYFASTDDYKGTGFADVELIIDGVDYTPKYVVKAE